MQSGHLRPSQRLPDLLVRPRCPHPRRDAGSSRCGAGQGHGIQLQLLVRFRPWAPTKPSKISGLRLSSQAPPGLRSGWGAPGEQWAGGGSAERPASALGRTRPYDGYFAGRVFDSAGIPRFAAATYIRAGGRGGGAAAEVSADLARFILGP